jgi:hypothetical protein
MSDALCSANFVSSRYVMSNEDLSSAVASSELGDAVSGQTFGITTNTADAKKAVTTWMDMTNGPYRRDTE